MATLDKAGGTVIRLFTGFLLPEAAADTLSRCQTGMKGAKWSRQENLHVTLRFIGSVPLSKCAGIETVLQGIRWPVFTYDLDGVDYWPNGILHAVVKENPALSALKDQQEAKLASIGFLPENQTFRPHVTLARLRRSQAKAEIEQWLKQHAGFCISSITANRFHLFESRSGKDGVRYIPLATYPAV